MKLTKMHGIGNDYLYFHEEVPVDVKELAVRLSDRHKSLGSDGLIYICRSECADFRMRIFNADGSEAAMCGNGIRCVGKYVYEKGLTDKEHLQIETNSGIRSLQLEVHNGIVRSVTVDMGTAQVAKPEDLEADGQIYAVVPVSTGNPHAVIFTDESGLSQAEKTGPLIEHHPRFPGGVNTEFVQILGDNRIRIRVWERGSGITMACGTGACASAAASVASGYCKAGQPVHAILDGGELEITVMEDMRILMKGPAQFAYEAEIRDEYEKPIVNRYYADLKDSYLFAGISAQLQEFQKNNPGKRLLRLGIGDVSLPLCPAVIDALHHAVTQQGYIGTFHGYMPECGDPKLRERIAGYYKSGGVGIESSEVFVSSGASDELGDILHLFDRGLPTMLMEPAYPAYADANIMEGRTILYIETGPEDSFVPMPPDYDVTALIYLCSPNNPTGASYNRDQLQKWVDYANRTGSVIIFDAAYEAYITDEDVPHSILEIENAETCAIEICSLSKTAGFTGTRCGYTVIPHSLKRDGQSLNAMWVRNRTTRTNGISYILQKGAEAVFTEQGMREVKEMISVYRRNAKVFMKALDEAGLWYTGGRNAPYVWVRCPDGMDSWEYFRMLLEKAQIVGTPGEGFGKCGEGYIRFSMFASYEDVLEAGRRIIAMNG